MMKRITALLLILCLLLTGALAESVLSLDALMAEIEEEYKGLQVQLGAFEISPDRRSIYLDRPSVTGAEDYTIAYNIYDAQSNPVNYFYSLEERVAATPGYKGLFNVFVVVTDTATGEQVINDIGWTELLGPEGTPDYEPLQVGRVRFSLSENRQSIYLHRPEITGGSGRVRIAYNIYDAQSNPVNYFYSDEEDVAATPGYAGHFTVFVVVSDLETGEQDTQNIGWHDLVEPEPVYELPVELDDIVYGLNGDGVMAVLRDKYGSNSVNQYETWRPVRGPFRDSVNGQPVKAIEESAFDTRTSGSKSNHAEFQQLISLPSQLEVIGPFAFAHCKFAAGQQLALPSTLKRIGNFAFDASVGLTGTLVLPEGLTEIGNYAFADCTGLTGDLIIPDTVTSIGDGAFMGCTGLNGKLVVPQGCSIGPKAFAGTNLTGDAVTETWPLILNGITYKLLDGELAITANTTGSTAFAPMLNNHPLRVIGESACAFMVISRQPYRYNTMKGELALPSSIRSIGESAFSRQTGISSLVLNEGLESIGGAAFKGCTGLTGDLIIPSTVKSIGIRAFLDCSNLDGTVVIPAGCTVGFGAFSGTKLTVVYAEE